MVGNLYTEGSHLKDRAYNIFYMGINVGAFLAPVVAEFMKSRFGFHPAFAVAVGGMAISIFVLWKWKKHIEMADTAASRGANTMADTAAVAVDAPPASVSHQDANNAGRRAAMDAIPDWKRVAALLVIFLIVIVFWMVFHQNGTTITYWGNENTNWKVTGIISNAINPGWVIILTFPVIMFWRWLDKKGLEPSTPTKMVIRNGPDCGSIFGVLHCGKDRRRLAGAGSQPLRTWSLQDVAALAARRLRSADGRRVDAVADGVVPRLKGRADQMARGDDGWLVRRHGPRQQAYTDWSALGRLAALDVLDFL